MDREHAEARMRKAKDRWTKAAVAMLHNWPLAQQMVADALEELNAARAELRSLE